ncbi:MAG TPA: alanine racemase [Acidimicrobiales bacterium]|nr:alanine racemase [Acidimicrobiales bacterium]
MPERSGRPAWAEVDLDAVRHNVAALVDVADGAALCAVVKADGYGHGAVPVARAALEAGASWLGVALASEGAVLRDTGIDAPILVLSEPSAPEWADLVALGLRATVHTEAGIEAASAAVTAAGRSEPLPVHLKVDTGMHRIGVAPGAALDRARSLLARDTLALEGVWTHCAVADEPGHPATDRQLLRFEAVLADLRAAGIDPPLVHAANSAATIDHPALRYDLVRCGIAVYGLAPSPALADRLPLRPALSLRAEVSHVQVVPAGDAVSYGLRRAVVVDTVVATLPLGYADGVPRRLGDVGGEVLVGGRRCPLAGTVTMDQLMVDCGPVDDPLAPAVAAGDEAVLLGAQGEEQIDAWEWAERLDTIAYEVTCGISARVPRRHRGQR